MTEAPERVERTELIVPEPAEALANLIGTEVPTRTLPPLWHWTYLLERRRHAELGPDGHPTTGIPAPPGPGRRRMFAGGRVTTYGEIRFGEPATRLTSVTSIRETVGRTGPLTFVTVRNEYIQAGELLVVDENDIVYRSGDSGSLPAAESEAADTVQPERRSPSLRLNADVAFLFRFSALTYNAHRIHYDHNWVKQEGYADIVVHGPLQALMMAELFRRTDDGLIGRLYTYRLVSPMVGPQTFTVMGDIGGRAEVRAENGTVTAVSKLSPIEGR